ncbi:MAG TPA: ferritin-like domain-containing protein [Chthoniobacterales bacterium]
MRGLGLGAAMLSPAAALLTSRSEAFAGVRRQSSPTDGDIAILQFAAAAELIEQDLWEQYTELALHNPAYGAALAVIDDDMNQYIHDNTDDEASHAKFLNAYLTAIGATPVNLDAFRNLPSSQATGAKQKGRLTNLMNLTVDTSWWIRYRSRTNPDFGAVYPQFIQIVNFPAIPPMDFANGSDEIQAIANAAAFHFGTIEQGGTSLYASFIPKASSADLLQILPSIGGAEIVHFTLWHDKAGSIPAVSVPGVTFPDIGSFDGDPLRQDNLIMPQPCMFFEKPLPFCSVIRPVQTQPAGAIAAATALTNSNLFQGQSQEFLDTLNTLAVNADAAMRMC